MIYYLERPSSLIKDVYYDNESLELTITFIKYYVPFLIYEGISLKQFMDFSEATSIGKHYLQVIKKQFKIKIMSDEQTEEKKKKPKTINKVSDKIRFIQMDLDVTKINKEWLIDGKKGTYLRISLGLRPDGDLDKYDQLGMVTQPVPYEVWKKDNKLQGPILGNGVQFAPKGYEDDVNSGTLRGDKGDDENINDDLPF